MYVLGCTDSALRYLCLALEQIMSCSYFHGAGERTSDPAFVCSKLASVIVHMTLLQLCF